MDLIGSIGTRLTVYDYSEAFANAGIKPVVIDTGEYKSMGEPGTEITDAHKAEFQRLVDGYFADFRQVVQRGRGLSDQSFEAIGDGRLFFAEESTRNGLIDGILKVSDVLNSMQAANAARRRIASI
jgi:protease-4